MLIYIFRLESRLWTKADFVHGRFYLCLPGQGKSLAGSRQALGGVWTQPIIVLLTLERTRLTT